MGGELGTDLYCLGSRDKQFRKHKVVCIWKGKELETTKLKELTFIERTVLYI